LPDISMCGNRDCTQRNNCYRYRAKPNPYRQTWAGFEQNEDGSCDMFASIEGYEQEYLRDTILIDEQYDFIIDIIDNPPEPNEALKKLMREES